MKGVTARPWPTKVDSILGRVDDHRDQTPEPSRGRSSPARDTAGADQRLGQGDREEPGPNILGHPSGRRRRRRGEISNTLDQGASTPPWPTCCPSPGNIDAGIGASKPGPSATPAAVIVRRPPGPTSATSWPRCPTSPSTPTRSTAASGLSILSLLTGPGQGLQQIAPAVYFTLVSTDFI